MSPLSVLKPLLVAYAAAVGGNLGLEEGGGLITAGESSKSSDMSYSKASSSDGEELISASASDSRDCKTVFSNGGRTAIGRSSVSTEVGLGVAKCFDTD
ncbi:hypothetical protein AVEN_10524-1 [Araneus ventricosus]|uniref:Secreted protein n=1 Tax=Araneus ventricosus TaxID=182803 RepID=A0A4Y2PTA4_ARAVE|nr:hypothetical protein AVEN_10524-1 [Araneus ventricosus]